MKTIQEMTDQEILALTPENLDHMVKLRMAEEGIKILPYPSAPELITIPDKDDFAYDIKGTELLFREKADAEAIADFILSYKEKALTEDYTNDYNYKHLAPVGSVWRSKEFGVISRCEFYTKETLASTKKNIEENARIKKLHDAEMSEYNNSISDGESIREEIHGRYNEVVEKYEEFERLKRRYSEYLELADNQPDIAMNFLKKAYKVSEEAEDYILPKPF
jgi:hypothetical protein